VVHDKGDVPVSFVELGVNVFNGIVEFRDNDVLDGIYTSIGSFDDFIQDRKCGLWISLCPSIEEDVPVARPTRPKFPQP
jgi:hypothetical protein